MAEQTQDKPKPLRGNVKGGARYPRYSLKDAQSWVSKLVSKTHLAPQPRDVIAFSVVDSKGTTGEIKISALKQFGLIDGPSTAYTATDLARKISNSPKEDVRHFLEVAALLPIVFKSLFDTFHGDTVSAAKLRQRASDFNVHPDNLAQCIAIYSESMVEAGLATVEGDKIIHKELSRSTVDDVTSGISTTGYNIIEDSDLNRPSDLKEDTNKSKDEPLAPRAIFNVTVSLDSSLDTDKLERQLALLKRYGAI